MGHWEGEGNKTWYVDDNGNRMASPPKILTVTPDILKPTEEEVQAIKRGRPRKMESN